MTQTNWVQSASQVEQVQLRLLYAAVYEVLGKKQFETDPTIRMLEFVTESNLKRVHASRRFPPLKRVTDSLSKSLRKVSVRKATEVFEWLLKDNPDKLLLRLIRQELGSCRAASALGKMISWYARSPDLKNVVSKGEHWLTSRLECNVFLHNPPRHVMGQDLAGRPLIYVRGDQSPFFFSKRGVALWDAYFSEQISTVMQDHADGATFIYDITGFPEFANIETSVIKFMSDCFSSNYPGQVAKMIIHNAPKVFENGAWKVYAAVLKSQTRNKVAFTYNTQDLAQFAAPDQLPPKLGGFSEFQYRWLGPEPGEVMQPVPEELLARQQSLIGQFEALTVRWILALYDQDHFEELRANLLQEWSALYWELDKYYRPRSVLDRSGLAARLRPETVGGVARELVYEGDDELSTGDSDVQSINSGYDSIATRTSRYTASISGSTRRALGFLKDLGKRISIASARGDNASLRDSASVR